MFVLPLSERMLLSALMWQGAWLLPRLLLMLLPSDVDVL